MTRAPLVLALVSVVSVTAFALVVAGGTSGCAATGSSRSTRSAHSARSSRLVAEGAHGPGASGSQICGPSAADCLPIGVRDVLVVDLVALRADSELRAVLVGLRTGGAAGGEIGDLGTSPHVSGSGSATESTAQRAHFDAAFERTWSFAPRAVVAIAYGSYQPGELAIIDGEFDAASVVRHVGERMNTVEIADEAPPRRVGFVGTERLDVAAIGPHRLAVAREHGAPMMRLLGRMRGRAVPTWLERAPESVRTRVHDAVLARGGTATPFVAAFAMDGRFPLETEVGLVLARTRWAVFSLAPSRTTPPDAARVTTSVSRSLARLSLHGELPEGADANLLGLVRTIAASEYGGVFGIREAIDTLRLDVGADFSDIRLDLDADRFAAGVALLLTSPQDL